MTLGRNWFMEDPRGWWMSEKLDGCRAYWDGANLWTRSGERIAAPDWFTARLPKGVQLDGEIWAGRGQFQAASNAVRLGGKWWNEAIRFVAFDAPEAEGIWPQRMAAAQTIYGECVDVIPCSGIRQMKKLYKEIRSMGGEGLMLRNPKTTGYHRGRTCDLLKVKAENQPE